MEMDVKTLGGSVLLSGFEFDYESFRVQFFDDWKIEIAEDPEHYHYEFLLGDVQIAMLTVPTKEENALAGCAMNYEWAGSQEAVEAHRGHVQVGILNCENPLRRYVLFTMIVSSMMKQDGVIGLYRYPKVYRGADFVEQAEVLKKEDIPATLWVHVGVHQDEEGFWNCYTYGMEDFGKEDMEILHCKSGLLDMYQFMWQVVRWLIPGDQVLTPDQGIQVSPNEICRITRSEAVAFDGMSLKLEYRNQ